MAKHHDAEKVPSGFQACHGDERQRHPRSSQHLVVRDVSLQGSRLALPGSAAQENMPAEIRQQLEALDDEWHQQHNRFSEQQKCLFIPVEWLGRIEASLQDVGH